MRPLFRYGFGLVLVAAVGTACLVYVKYLNARPEEPPIPKVVVCIDPGHPSEYNSGYTVQNGTTETAMDWAVAVKLQEVLNEDDRIKAIKTRDGRDQFMRNHDRALVANVERAAITVHLHCDHGPSHGFTVYYPDRQGMSEGKRGPSPEIMLSSSRAAEVVHAGMAHDLSGILHDRGIKGESFTRIGKRHGSLTSSVWSEVPTLTIEMIFLNSQSDADFIKSEAGQTTMAKAIADGIKDYIRPELEKRRK